MTGLETAVAIGVATVLIPSGMYLAIQTIENDNDKTLYILSHFILIGFGLDLLLGLLFIVITVCSIPELLEEWHKDRSSEIPAKEMETVIQNLAALGVEQRNEHAIMFNQGVDLNIKRQQIEFRKTNKIYKISSSQVNKILALVKEDKTLSLLKDLGSALEEAKLEADKRNH